VQTLAIRTERGLEASVELALGVELEPLTTFYVREGERWEFLDTLPLASIEPEGEFLEEDGGLLLSVTRIDPLRDGVLDPAPDDLHRFSASELSRIVAWANEVLAFRFGPPARPSALAAAAGSGGLPGGRA
jgi:hypothetical protein